ncbi:MAG: hypothetical protein M1814_001351 [Vezdaea aestivalis]|nr:MAG: hypothetical protein M1814_001351 [Vezdaea aestivalis]
MSPQRYEPVAATDDEVSSPTVTTPTQDTAIPNSPPPSFRSRASSPTARLLSQDPLHSTSAADRALADSFDLPSDDEDNEQDGSDDRQRLIRIRAGNGASAQSESGSGAVRPQPIERRVTQFPSFPPGQTSGTGRVMGGGANDGVFANLNAKPERGEKEEEQPPTYEAAAADASPPYWETTILAPGLSTDEVYFQGLPVGSIFSFAWNGMISMSFQFVGFLLTYLLHTTHAAKNGSLTGLGVTLVQLGFQMRGHSSSQQPEGNQYTGQPPDPNSHDFDPASVAAAAAMGDGSGAAAAGSGRKGGILETTDLLAYGLMIVGWLVMIRACTNFFKARKHEQLVLQSPDRGATVVVAEGETSETAV